MEINYFLDAKQAEFDELIKSLYKEEGDLDSRSSPTMMTGVTMETYSEVIYTTTDLDT